MESPKMIDWSHYNEAHGQLYLLKHLTQDERSKGEDELRNVFYSWACSNNCEGQYIIQMYRLDKNGRRRYVEQCQACGKCTPIKKSRVKDWWLEFKENEDNTEMILSYVSDRLSRAAEKILTRYRVINQERAQNRYQKYQNYLQSKEWRQKRARVIKRCNNVCEGCGCKPVDHVHHLTYETLYDEFLFHLVGLCHQCHMKAHGRTFD